MGENLRRHFLPDALRLFPAQGPFGSPSEDPSVSGSNIAAPSEGHHRRDAGGCAHDRRPATALRHHWVLQLQCCTEVGSGRVVFERRGTKKQTWPNHTLEAAVQSPRRPARRLEEPVGSPRRGSNIRVNGPRLPKHPPEAWPSAHV